MKKLLVAVMALVGVAVATSVSQAQPTASSAAAVSCGTTRTIGFMAPFTGPAASVGQQQVRWNKFYVSQYNKTHKTKIKVVNQDTQLGAAAGTAETTKGAKALASNTQRPRCRRPGRLAGERGRPQDAQGRRVRLGDRVRDRGQARRGQERHARATSSAPCRRTRSRARRSPA